MFARRSFALVLAVLIATIAASLGTRVAQAGGGCHEPLTDAHGASVLTSPLLLATNDFTMCSPGPDSLAGERAGEAAA